jgi:hypothetical protein
MSGLSRSSGQEVGGIFGASRDELRDAPEEEERAETLYVSSNLKNIDAADERLSPTSAETRFI